MDQILNNTLQGTATVPTAQPELPPIPTGLKVPEYKSNLNADIRSLTAARQDPNLLMDFQKVMANTSRQAYTERQTTELNQAATQFDPSKVSGGTFAGIIGNLEANRGADVSKIYASTLNAYAAAQEQITNRLEFLEQLKEQKRQFDEQTKLEKAKLKILKKTKDQEYKLAKKEFDFKKSSWEREFALAQAKAGRISSSTGYLNQLGVDIGQIRAVYEQFNAIATNPVMNYLNSLPR